MDNLINMGQGVQFANLIKENDYKYSSFYETSITKFEKREMLIATRPTVTKILDAISKGNMMMTISPDNKIFVKSRLKLTSDETFSLEAETVQQSLRLCNQTPSFKNLWAIQKFINLKLVSGG